MPTLFLESLKCVKQQEFPGNDEVYILVNGDPVWDTSAMKTGQLEQITGVAPIQFEPRAEIKLFERDGADPDDLLGVNFVSDSPLGKQKLTFLDGSASYVLWVDVRA